MNSLVHSSALSRRLRSVAAILAVLLYTLPVLAQEPEGQGTEQASPWTLGVALGQGRRDNPFVGSDDIQLNAVLDIAWYGERFFFDNGDVGLNLSTTDQLSLNALVVFNNERNYYSYLNNGSSGLDLLNLKRIAQEQGLDSPSIAGGEGVDLDSLTIQELEPLVFQDVDSSLAQRDFAVSSGLEFIYSHAWGDIQGQLLADVSDVHGGQSAWLAYSYPWYTPKSEVSLSLGLDWKSASLVDYYYGVQRDERIDGRPSYRAGSGVNSVIRLSARHALSDRWHLVGVMEREYLSGAIRNSPIIKRDAVNTIFLGLYYQFK